MDPMIAQHLPLITNRIPFLLNPPPMLPALTNRKEFLDSREPLAMPTNPNPSTLPDTASSLKYSASVVYFGAQKETARNQDKGKGIEEEQVQKEQNEVNEITELIPKPPGEPGRPHCGGYHLDDVLSVWGAETLSKVMVCLATTLTCLHYNY